MNDGARRDETVLEVALDRIEAVCEAFEAKLRKGDTPRIEDYLKRARLAERPKLLEELILLELSYGEPKSPAQVADEYRSRFAADQDVVGHVLARIARPQALDTRPDDDRPEHQDQQGPMMVETMSCRVGKTLSVGRYELLEGLGSGSFGQVWKARDRDLERLVAVKIPHRLPVEEAETERFFREARAAAQLRHPGIVSVHDVNCDHNVAYIVSDFVQAASLDEWLQARSLTPIQAARLIIKLAEAMDYAHQQGVIHRDLKPSNILIDGEGEPHIADFGLAKRETTDVTMTVEGQVLGTPAYMSPQQASGQGHKVDGRTDIYSLGVILFQLLTGELPFRGSTRMLIVQILNEEPPNPRSLKSGIHRDLATIALKCLEKDPGRRYRTSGDLAADLKRWLAGEPIKARPVGRVERLSRWCRRNPAVASLATGVVTLLLIVAAGSLIYSVRMSRYAETERVLRTDEQRARTEAEEYFLLTIDAINEMLADVGQQSLSHVPLMEPVRKSLLQKALVLYQKLLKSQPSHATLQQEFARTQHRMGQIYDLLGEHDGAQAAYTEAIRRFERLRDQSPGDLEVKRQLGLSHSMLAELFRRTAPKEAQGHFETALNLQEELHQSLPDDLEIRQELSLTLNNLGLLLTETGHFAKAEAALTSAIGHLLALVDKSGKAHECLADLGRCQINLGVLLRKQAERAGEAEIAYRDAIRNLERAVELAPENREYRHRSAIARLDLGNLLLQGKPEEALEETLHASAQLRKLCEDFPSIPLYWQELANSLNSEANVLAGLARLDDAKQRLEEANGVLDELARDFPEHTASVAEYQSLKGIVLGGLGALAQMSKEHEAARTQIEVAIVHQQQAAELGPANPTYLERLAGHHQFLAQILRELDETSRADAMESAADAFLRKAAQLKAATLEAAPFP
jgi:serine/threonine-protein kinase